MDLNVKKKYLFDSSGYYEKIEGIEENNFFSYGLGIALKAETAVNISLKLINLLDAHFQNLRNGRKINNSAIKNFLNKYLSLFNKLVSGPRSFYWQLNQLRVGDIV